MAHHSGTVYSRSFHPVGIAEQKRPKEQCLSVPEPAVGVAGKEWTTLKGQHNEDFIFAFVRKSSRKTHWS